MKILKRAKQKNFKLATYYYTERQIEQMHDEGKVFTLKEEYKIDNDTPWNSALKIHTGLSEHVLKPCIKEILKFLKKSLPGLKGKSIYNKYNTHSHHYVSKMIEEGACNKNKKSD